jgi:hypothetical protein
MTFSRKAGFSWCEVGYLGSSGSKYALHANLSSPKVTSTRRRTLLCNMSVVVNHVTTDQFADHGADQNIGREMIQTADTCQARRLSFRFLLRQYSL